MDSAALNPWLVESIDAFTFICCPECVYRSKEVNNFQAHALQNHPQSIALFHDHGPSPSEPIVKLKTEPEDLEVAFDLTEFEDHFQDEADVEDNDIKKESDEEDFANNQDFDIEEDEDDEYHLEDHKPKLKRRKKSSSRSGSKAFKCYVCPQEFPKVSLMRLHMRQDHTNIKCEECEKVFENPVKLAKHRNAKHVFVKCVPCDKSFIKSVYDRHMKTVHVDKSLRTFKCEHCPYSVHAQRYLNEHMKEYHDMNKTVNKVWRPLIKTGENEYGDSTEPEPNMAQCSDCGKEVHQSKLVVHYQRAHKCLPPGYEPGKYMCHQCPAALRSKLSLQKHIESFHNENKPKSYACDPCKMNFKEEGHLICHYRSVHKDIPPEFKDRKLFLCDQCPAVFLSKHLLKYHVMRKHYDVINIPKPKTYAPSAKKISVCPHCDKRFSSKRNFHEHIKVVHEKYTPFECDQCARKFGMKQTLDSHKQIVHSKVPCDICGQEIYNSFELKRHKASVHGIIPKDVFQCEHCPLFFKSAKNLGYHVSNKHL